MQPSVPAIFDDLDAPLLDYLAGRAGRQSPAPPRRERPALDSCRLLEIFSPFLAPATDE